MHRNPATYGAQCGAWGFWWQESKRTSDGKKWLTQQHSGRQLIPTSLLVSAQHRPLKQSRSRWQPATPGLVHLPDRLYNATITSSHPLVEAACFLPCARWVFTFCSCCRHLETDPEWVISLILTDDCHVLWWLDKHGSTSQFHNASFYSLTVFWGLFN